MAKNDLLKKDFYTQVAVLLQAARSEVVVAVNQTMVRTYFEIGKMLVHEEQDGSQRAGYGKEVVKKLSLKLTQEFGKGFSERNIEQMRQFYLVYSIPQTVSAVFEDNKPQTASAGSKMEVSFLKKGSDAIILSWSHYLKLMRIDDANERSFYEIESFKNNWSVRELKRQFDTALYARLVLSRDKEKVKELSEKGLVFKKPSDLIKDPYILEFIGLPENAAYSEDELEQEIIDKLEHFLLELGNGFTFVARQKRITFDEKHFRIDLVFYNRILRCFVLIDLKIGELKHQDLGQMQMYVNYYDREIRLEDENKTIGIVLCKDKSEAVVEYTLPENNSQIFASKYKTVLPSKEELKLLIQAGQS